MRYFCHEVNKSTHKNNNQSNSYYKRHKRAKWCEWKRRRRNGPSSSSSAAATLHPKRNETKLSNSNPICQSSSGDGAQLLLSEEEKEEETQTIDPPVVLQNDQNSEQIQEVPFEIIEAEDILLWGCPPLKIPRMAFIDEDEKDLFALVVQKAASVPMYRKCKQFLVTSGPCTLAFEHWDEFFNGPAAYSRHADDLKKIILSWSDFNPFIFDFDVDTRTPVDSSVYSSAADHFVQDHPEDIEDDGIYRKIIKVPSGHEKKIAFIQQQRTSFPTSSSNFESSPIIRQYSSSEAPGEHQDGVKCKSTKNTSNSLEITELHSSYNYLNPHKSEDGNDDRRHLIIPAIKNNTIKSKTRSPIETQILYQGQSISVSTNGTLDSGPSDENRYVQDSLITNSADFYNKAMTGQKEPIEEEESFYCDDDNNNNNNEVAMNKLEQFFNIRMINSLPTFYTNVQSNIDPKNSLNRRRASIAIAQQDPWEDETAQEKNPGDITVTAEFKKKINLEVLEVFRFKSRKEKHHNNVPNESLQENGPSQHSLLSFSPKDSFNSSFEGSPMILNILGENFPKSGQDLDEFDDEGWTCGLQGSESMDGENYHPNKFYPPPTPPMGSKKIAIIKNNNDPPNPEQNNISSRPRVWQKSVFVNHDDTEKSLEPEKSSEKLIIITKKEKMTSSPSTSSRCNKKSILKNTKSQSNNSEFMEEKADESIPRNNNETTTTDKSSSSSSSSPSSSTSSYRRRRRRTSSKKMSKPTRSQLIFRRTRRKRDTLKMDDKNETSSISGRSGSNSSCSEHFKLKQSQHHDDSSSMTDDQERTIKSKLRLKKSREEDSNNYNISKVTTDSRVSTASSYFSKNTLNFNNNNNSSSKRSARGKQQLSLWQKMRRCFFGSKSSTENVQNTYIKFESKQNRSSNFCERIVCWWRRESHRRIAVRQDSIQLIRLKRQRLLREIQEFSEDVQQVCKNPRVRDQNDPLRFDTRPKAKVVHSEGCLLLREQRALSLIDAENGNKPKEKMESPKPIKGILKYTTNTKKIQKRINYQYN